MASVKEFEKKFMHSIENFDCEPGSLVLVRNSKVDSSIGQKTKPRYLGPMVVVRRTAGGSYILAELDGSLSRLRFAAYRVVPYLPRSKTRIPVTSISNLSNRELSDLTHDRDGEVGNSVTTVVHGEEQGSTQL